MAARQTVVNTQPGLGVAGDFASTNPRYTLLQGAGGSVAGANGLTIGLFAWAEMPMDADGAPATLNNFGTGQPAGIIAREQQGLVTQYLADSSMVIPAGFMATCFTSGDFFLTNNGTTPALPGQKVYANFANGQATAAATGSPTTGATSTASSIAPETFSVTGSILNDVLTISAVGSGNVWPGATLAGTGVNSGTLIQQQLSGTAGGVGTYLLNQAQPQIASETLTGTWGQLTVGGTVAGSFGVNDVISGAGVTAGSTITAQLTGGAGGAGTYVTQTQTVAGPEAINIAAINIETNWKVDSYAAPGALMKVSRLP